MFNFVRKEELNRQKKRKKSHRYLLFLSPQKQTNHINYNIVYIGRKCMAYLLSMRLFFYYKSLFTLIHIIIEIVCFIKTHIIYVQNTRTHIKFLLILPNFLSSTVDLFFDHALMLMGCRFSKYYFIYLYLFILQTYSIRLILH